MKKFVLLILLGVYCFPLNLHAGSDQMSQSLYESIHFAENGNDIVLEIDKAERALADGADPNWVNPQKAQSVLHNFVGLISLSNDPIVTEKGVRAIKMLFENNAKLQYCDGPILYFPIAFGKYEIVRILLENGASATFWPKDEIGSDITPIEVATKHGYDQIAELLLNYGAKRVKKEDAVQMRFIGTADSGSLNELKGLGRKGQKLMERTAREKQLYSTL